MEKQRKAGVADPRLDEFRWHLEELRVSLFAQELKTPYPVSYKRLEKIWNTILRFQLSQESKRCVPGGRGLW